MQNPSLFKFLVANVKSGIFTKEDRFVKMCDRVEKMKDVGAITKMKMLLGRLMPRTRRVKSEELVASEHSFNQVTKTEVGVSLFKDQNRRKPLRC